MQLFFPKGEIIRLFITISMIEIPTSLLNELEGSEGFDREDFIAAHQQEVPVSIRLNPFKNCEMDLLLANKIDWCENSFYLNERPSFTHDALFHAGAYYVQEAGSMFLEWALKTIKDLPADPIAMDLCGSPGGKSTILSSFLSNKGLLISNEVIKTRTATLVQNLNKWGTDNSLVINNDPKDLEVLSGEIDLLIIDAPCSGSGLFRKQPDAIQEWSEENVSFCASRQKRILSDSISLLKDGGYLFYSTCSYSFEENESNVEWMIKELDFELKEIEVRPEWGIVKTELGYRFYPHRTKSEGFFCALLRKKESGNVKRTRKQNKKQNNFVKNSPYQCYFPEKQGEIVKFGEFFHFLPQQFEKLSFVWGSNLYLKKAGVCLGEMKGNDIIPNHELALSFNAVHNQKINLNKEDALIYLRKQELKVQSPLRGFSLLEYKGLGIGWGKVLDRRFNNYLPSELRILS